MKEAAFNQSVDKWFEAMSRRKGETTVPAVGSHPPDLKTGLHSSLNNEYVTTDLIRHYAEAIGDRNPLWRYEDYAKKSVWGGIIAPPTITDAIAISWPTKRGALTDIDFELAGLPAGSKREWFEVIRPGDRFRIVDELVNIEEKKTKQQGIIRLFLETIKRSYINQKDETAAVVHCRMVHLATPPREEGIGGTVFSGGERKRHVFTDAEREAIIKGYDTETRRGNNPLYWNDVTVGQELKTLLVGPVTTWHTVAWLAALAGYAVAFDMEWDILKADMKFAWFDPKLNVWKCGGEGHLVDGAGHSGFSGGHAFAYGAQIEGLICRSLYNWMGDGGFLKEMDCAFRNIPILGDAYHIHASVTNKYTEGDEHLVDLKVNCENQDGLVLVPGTAKVRLPAR